MWLHLSSWRRLALARHTSGGQMSVVGQPTTNNSLTIRLRTLWPLTAFKKCPEPQIFQKFVPTIVFFGVPIRGTQICQKVAENSKMCLEIVFFFFFLFLFFDKFLTNLGPPDWNPEKQSSGQIFDKFGVLGIFECCKGPEGSQPYVQKSKQGALKELCSSDMIHEQGPSFQVIAGLQDLLRDQTRLALKEFVRLYPGKAQRHLNYAHPWHPALHKAFAKGWGWGWAYVIAPTIPMKRNHTGSIFGN